MMSATLVGLGLVAALGQVVATHSINGSSIACDARFQRLAHPKPDLSLSPTNTSFDSWNLYAPFVAKIGTRWHLYYSGGPETQPEYLAYQIGLATAPGPEGPWTKHGTPLLPLGEEDNFHATPTLLRGANNEVIREGGLYSMLYCGNRNDTIYRATSSDGVVWTKNTTALFTGYAPNVLRGPDGQLWLYSIRKPARKLWEVSLAKGQDWDSLKTVKTVLVSNTQPWEHGNMFYPFAMYDHSGWTLAWSAYSNNSATHGGIPCIKDPKNHDECLQTTAIGIAHSSDGMAFAKCESNPVLWPVVRDSFDSTYVGCPCFVTAEVHTPLLYYAGRVDQIHKYFSIGHVRITAMT